MHLDEPEPEETTELEPEPEETTETELEPESEETEKDDDGGDPGIIIIFRDPDDVHATLGLGSVPNIVRRADVAPNVPVLQQGKLKAYLLL